MGALLTAGERRRAPCAPPAFSICDSEFMRARICVNVPSIPVTSISRCPEPRAMRRRRDADCARACTAETQAGAGATGISVKHSHGLTLLNTEPDLYCSHSGCASAHTAAASPCHRAHVCTSCSAKGAALQQAGWQHCRCSSLLKAAELLLTGALAWPRRAPPEG